MSLYNNCKRTRDKTPIMLERFYINDIPVCMSWYGDSEHKQEVCLFLQFRKFGTVPVCAFTGKDTNDEPDVINRVPEWCPLHKEEV